MPPPLIKLSKTYKNLRSSSSLYLSTTGMLIISTKNSKKYFWYSWFSFYFINFGGNLSIKSNKGFSSKNILYGEIVENDSALLG